MEDASSWPCWLARRELSHYQADIMLATTRTSVAGEPPRVSRLTLALLVDSGGGCAELPLQLATYTHTTRGCLVHAAPPDAPALTTNAA